MADVVARGLRFHVQRLAGRPQPLSPTALASAAAPPARPTVVFLHGLVMDNLSSWYFTAANPVAQVADVVLYDLRGHGKTERPPSHYAIDDHVADLAALLDVLAVQGPVILVGNSFGGVLALAFARAHPQRAAGVVLVDAHTGSHGFGEEMAATLSLEGEARDAKIAESFRAWLGRHSDRKKTRLASAAEALVHRTTLVADLRSSPALHESDFEEVQAPVLALYGETSDVRERGVQLAAALPHCELVVLRGCTHSVLWEATDEVRRRIVLFVERFT